MSIALKASTITNNVNPKPGAVWLEKLPAEVALQFLASDAEHDPSLFPGWHCVMGTSASAGFGLSLQELCFEGVVLCLLQQGLLDLANIRL